MKLDGFKELLVKKTDDEFIQTLIKHVSNDILTEYVYEALEKMARAKHKGETANPALHDFADNIDPGTHPDMIRDAIGHHVSRYKAAVNTGNQDMANHHGGKALKIMNLVDKMQKHSDGALTMTHVPIQPWERHGKLSRYEADHPKVLEGKYKAGDFKTKTKGLNYSNKDLSWLQNAPHHSYASEVKRTKEAGSYPFEKVAINGKYIHVDDDVDLHDGNASHEFDHHPVHKFGSVSDWTENHDNDYLEAVDKYHDEDGHMDKWINRHEDIQSKDPEGYAARGSKVSDSVHKPVEPLSLEPDTASAAKEGEGPKEEAALSPEKAKAIRAQLDKMPDEHKSEIMNMFSDEQKKLLGL